jgi:hypothetical protein
MSAVEFANLMKAANFEKKAVNGCIYWLGIGLTSTEATRNNE